MMSEPQMCVMCNFETDSPDELNDHLDREHKFISVLEPSLETQTSVNLNSTNESVKLDVAELVLQTQELITNQKNPSSSKITFRCQICYRSFINPIRSRLDPSSAGLFSNVTNKGFNIASEYSVR